VVRCLIEDIDFAGALHPSLASRQATRFCTFDPKMAQHARRPRAPPQAGGVSIIG